MATEPGPVVLTPKELASRWPLASSSIYRLKESGHLPYVQIAGAVRFKLSDALAYEAGGCQPAVIRSRLLRHKRRRVS